MITVCADEHRSAREVGWIVRSEGTSQWDSLQLDGLWTRRR